MGHTIFFLLDIEITKREILNAYLSLFIYCFDENDTSLFLMKTTTYNIIYYDIQRQEDTQDSLLVIS